MPGAAPEAERSERGEPDHFEVRILKGNANRLGIHPQASPSPAVDLHAMREFALLDEVIDVTLREECGIGADVPVVFECKRPHPGFGSIDGDLNHVL